MRPALKLVHDARDYAAVRMLARALDVEASLDGSAADIPVLPLYVCQLLDALARVDVVSEANYSPFPFRSIAVTMAFAFRKLAGDRQGLIHVARGHRAIARLVDEHIQADAWLGAVVGCAVALETALEDPEHIVWPAEVGNAVAALVLGVGEMTEADQFRRRSWVAGRLADARAEAAQLRI